MACSTQGASRPLQQCQGQVAILKAGALRRMSGAPPCVVVHIREFLPVLLAHLVTVPQPDHALGNPARHEADTTQMVVWVDPCQAVDERHVSLPSRCDDTRNL